MAKKKSKRLRTKHLTRKDVDKIEQNSYLKVKYPTKSIYNLALHPRHEHINYGIRQFIYGAIFGFILAVILMRILRLI